MNIGNAVTRGAFLIAFGVLLALPGIALAQPHINSFSFTPNSINTAGGPASVTVNFSASSSANINYFEMAFGDSSGVYLQRGFKVLNPAPNITDSVTVTFPRFSNSGMWTVVGVFLADSAGNTAILDSFGLAQAGFPTTLQITSTSDTTPPTLTAFSLSPASINTTSAAASTTTNFTVTDDLAGANNLMLVLTSPSGNATRSASATLTPALSVTGSASISFPQFSEAGTWTVSSVYISDAAGNTTILDNGGLAAAGFANTLTVTSASDTTAPNLTALSFTPTTINVTSAPATVTFTFQATDDLSGVTSFQTNFVSPSGAFVQAASSSFAATMSASGSAPTTFAKGSESGTWLVQSVLLTDAAGNTHQYATSDLAGLGFPTQLTVTNNTGDTTPPVVTPTVSPAPNMNGWNSTLPVTVSWATSDPESGISSTNGCGNSSVSAQTAGITFTCSATNGAGLTTTASVIVRVDLTPPVITPSLSPAPNAAGWNTGDTTVTWNLSDSLSGVDFDTDNGCATTTITGETAGTTLTCSAANFAGLFASTSVTVKIDLTAPTTTATASPAPNAAGWNNTNVTVTFAGADALSGVASCTSPVVLSNEGAGQSASGYCTDIAGNVGAPVTLSGIKIDKTAPAASNTKATPNPVEINVATTLTSTITDALSGVASAQYNIDGGTFNAMTGTFGGTSVNVSASVAAFATPGLHDLCVRGVDAAGNTSATDCIVLAVFDPNGGFATGGGGTSSPAGADLNNPTGTGNVTFGFSAKYLPNSTTPSGDVEFHYNAGSINFKSTSLTVLVVTSEPRAQLQGTGTINGSTSCQFSLDAWQGSFQPGNTDAFGIRIYNCGGATGDRYNLATKPTSQGSIKIHP